MNLCCKVMSLLFNMLSHEVMESLSHVQLVVTPWTVAHQAPPSMEFSRQEYWSGLPFPSPRLPCPSPTSGAYSNSNHLILCHPLLLLPSIFPSIRVFSNESVLRLRWPKYWSFSFRIRSSNEYSGLISFRID